MISDGKEREGLKDTDGVKGFATIDNVSLIDVQARGVCGAQRALCGAEQREGMQQTIGRAADVAAGQALPARGAPRLRDTAAL